MNKFQQLIDTLQTDLIILVDDDFTPIEDTQEILCYLSYLNSTDRGLFMSKLENIENKLIEPLNSLFNTLSGLELQENEIPFIESGLLLEFLKNRELEDLSKQVSSIIETIEGSDHKADIANLAMMYGLRLKASTETYNPFFDSLNEIGLDKSIRLYRGLEGDEFTKFEEEIRTVNELRGNKFPLLIVDRQLGNGHLGTEIIDNLRDGENQINRFLSVLYTSQEKELIEPTNLESYFHIQLRKDDPLALDKVSESLALSAFAIFFDQIFKYRSESLDSANRLVVESGLQNMIYLAGMAHAEGDTVFNVFNRWFDLLSDKKVQDKLLADDPEGFDLNFMIGLTTLINSNFISTIIDNKELNSQFHEEVERLETYEIFNHSINSFCSPPASGDIFDIDGQLFMLAGQDCDLVVRSNGATVNRNEKLAELIRCSFHPGSKDSKIDSSQIDRVSINHFELQNTKGVLEIYLSQKEFFDFSVLDLCCLNTDGISRFSTMGFPTSSTLKLLPEKWSKYIPNLIDQLNNKIKILEFLTREAIEASTLAGDFSFNVSHEVVDEFHTFPVQRIARIKGQFREYVLQRYWQYKTRMGLNTIGLYQRSLIKIQRVSVGFPYNLQELQGEHHAWLQLTGNRDKNRNKSKLDLILKKDDISSILDDEFKSFVEDFKIHELVIANEDLKLNNVIFSKVWNDEELSITIKFPLFNEFGNHYFNYASDSLTAYNIFGKESIRTNPKLVGILYVNGDSANQLLPPGAPPFKITIEMLNEGEIHIPEENIRLSFDQERGRLIIAGQINQGGDEEE